MFQAQLVALFREWFIGAMAARRSSSNLRTKFLTVPLADPNGLTSRVRVTY